MSDGITSQLQPSALSRGAQARYTCVQYAAPQSTTSLNSAYAVTVRFTCLLIRIISLKEASSLSRIPHKTNGASARLLPHTPSFLTFASNQHPSWPLTKRARRRILRSTTYPKRLLSLFFRLPLELREMIYTYVFALGPECSSDSGVAVAAPGDRYYKLSPSGVLLRTCRLINTDAANVFARATRNLTLVIDLSSPRRRRMNISPVPKLDIAQMSRLKRLVVIKHRLPSSKDLFEFVERLLPCGTAYWTQVGADPTMFAYDVFSMSSPMTNIRSLALSGARIPGVLKMKQFSRIMSDARSYRTRAPAG